MDQSLVTSGFDIEIALSERYLRYLLFLALDTGIIPVEFDFEDPADPGPGPFHARIIVPSDVDRTYGVDPKLAPEGGALDGFQVQILFANAFKADLKVTVVVHVTRAADRRNVNLRYQLFIRLGLVKTFAGAGLDTAGLKIQLTWVEGISDFSSLKARVDQTISLDDLGTGGRVQDIAMRKFPATHAIPAALVVYVNLLLRDGPEADEYVHPRGATSSGQNILAADADLVFATRKDIYAALSADAWFRRAVRSGSGYTYPLEFKDRHGTLLGIAVEPSPEGRLRLTIKAEIEVDNWFDPTVTLLVDIYGDVDDEGVMTWSSSVDGHVSSILYEFLLAGVAAALVPFIGPGAALFVFLGLEIAKGLSSGMITEALVGDKAEQRLDATLLDIAPNRLTVVRRRWDPFYETQHQIGLRPGGTLVTVEGFALWGRAALTRATKVIDHVVIRDTEHFNDQAPTALRYRVKDIDPFGPTLTENAPASDRRPFLLHDPVTEPHLFQLSIDEAVERMAVERLLEKQPYVLEATEPGNGLVRWIVISQREIDEQRNVLIAAHASLVSPQIRADHQAEVLEQVLIDFDNAGVIPTQEEIDAAVEQRLQALIDADAKAYADDTLPTDLEAAIKPLLRLKLWVVHLTALVERDLLTIEE